jgi:hypothetical protein
MPRRALRSASEFPLYIFKEVIMRTRATTLTTAAILIVGSSAVHADILCAVKMGFRKDTLRDRPGPMCPIGERLVNPSAVGLLGPPGQYAAKGMPIYDCSVCTEGRLSLISTCEFLEQGGFGHPPGATEGVETTNKPCKLVGYLIAP